MTKKATPEKCTNVLRQHIQCVDELLCNFSERGGSRNVRSEGLWSSTTKPDIASILKTYAPTGLDDAFGQLYSFLYPSIVEGNQMKVGSVFVQGPRGSGKSLLVERCLRAFQEEIQATEEGNQKAKTSLRVIRINGLLLPGKQVSVIIADILRQLSAISQQQSFSEADLNVDLDEETINNNNDDTNVSSARKRRRRARKIEEQLRFRPTSFNNQLQHLSEVIDSVSADPSFSLVFLLEEIDTFLPDHEQHEGQFLAHDSSHTSLLADNCGSHNTCGERQLLLYHLLDRIACSSLSFFTLVATGSDLTVLERLEKRVRSRAETSSQLIQVHGSGSPWRAIVQRCCCAGSFGKELEEQLLVFLQEAPSSEPADSADNESKAVYAVQQILERNMTVDKDARWLLNRVFWYALTLYRRDLESALEKSSASAPQLRARHLLEALLDCGAHIPKSMNVEKFAQQNASSPYVSSFSPRLSALLDLPGPAVALVLAAKRILTRDAQHDEVTTPLTLERLFREYQTSYRGLNKYTPAALHNAASSLLRVGLLRPGVQHGGSAALEYTQWSVCADITVLERVPLQATFDIHRELGAILQQDQQKNSQRLTCSTALREWGSKTN